MKRYKTFLSVFLTMLVLLLTLAVFQNIALYVLMGFDFRYDLDFWQKVAIIDIAASLIISIIFTLFTSNDEF